MAESRKYHKPKGGDDKKSSKGPRRSGGSFKPKGGFKKGSSEKSFDSTDSTSKTGRGDKSGVRGGGRSAGGRNQRGGRPAYGAGKGKSGGGFKKNFKPREEKPQNESDGLTRLNKFIANAGICSRREADNLIKQGLITVNGEVVTEMGYKLQPTDTVKYAGQTLKGEALRYVLLNKPKDHITTSKDPQNRKTVMHLVAKAGKERIYPVGRLDRNTTGVLLFTNDGELAKKLSHPKYGYKKIYHAQLDKNMKAGDMDKLLKGVELEDGLAQADAIAYVSGASKKEIGIEIHSGKNRIVRRMFAHLGYLVVKLDRVYFAGLTKKDLSRGAWRHLTEKEVNMLKMSVR